MIAGGISAPDPYVRQSNAPLLNESYSYSGRTQVHPAIVNGESTCVIVGFGDSTIANTINATYTATNAAKVQSLSIDNGGVYLAQDPQLGAFQFAGQGSLLARIGDKLISNGTYARVIFCLLGVNSAKIADWAAGGVLNYRIGLAAKRLLAVGLTPNFVLCQNGANDRAAGVGRSAYALSQQNVIDTFRSNGISCPFLVAQMSWDNGAVSSNILLAQSDVVNGTSVFAGPNLDALDNANRHDGVHFNATGRNAASDLWITRIGQAH